MRSRLLIAKNFSAKSITLSVPKCSRYRWIRRIKFHLISSGTRMRSPLSTLTRITSSRIAHRVTLRIVFRATPVYIRVSLRLDNHFHPTNGPYLVFGLANCCHSLGQFRFFAKSISGIIPRYCVRYNVLSTRNMNGFRDQILTRTITISRF